MVADETSAQLLTVEQTAMLFGVHPRTIRRAIQAGRLPAFNVGTGKRAFYRIDPRDLDALKTVEGQPRVKPSSDFEILLPEPTRA